MSEAEVAVISAGEIAFRLHGLELRAPVRSTIRRSVAVRRSYLDWKQRNEF